MIVCEHNLVAECRECENERLRTELAELAAAALPILSAYRSTEAHVTEAQITRAWAALDAARGRCAK